MGHHTRAICGDCGYQADLFEGPGMLVEHKIMLCQDCQEIVNIITSINPEAQDGHPKGIIPHCCPKCSGKISRPGR